MYSKTIIFSQTIARTEPNLQINHENDRNRKHRITNIHMLNVFKTKKQ